MTAPVLEVRDLEVSYPRPAARWFSAARRFKAIDGVAFSVQAGQTLGIVGESGCGKSTLGRAALRLQPASGGQVHWSGVPMGDQHGEPLRLARRALQMVFQDPSASLDPRMTVGSAIERPLLNYAPVTTAAERRAAVAAVMQRVGLDPAWHTRFPHELSGGQCQRVGIARALVLRPRLLLCDEPVSALDVSTQAQIVNLLAGLCRDDGLALVFISHNMAVVRHLCQRVLVLYLGQVVEEADGPALFSRPLHPYSRALIASVPLPDPVAERAKGPLPLACGDIPSAMDPPLGCRFRTRCPHAEARCATDVPPLRDVAPGRRVACHLVVAE